LLGKPACDDADAQCHNDRRKVNVGRDGHGQIPHRTGEASPGVHRAGDRSSIEAAPVQFGSECRNYSFLARPVGDA